LRIVSYASSKEGQRWMSTEVKAHGMNGSLVEPDWDPLTIEDIRALLSRLPQCGEALRIVRPSPRPFSSACVVQAEHGPAFVKRHHQSVRDREGLLEEHRFLTHLRAHGALVPRVLADVSGETAIESGDWTYEVHGVPTSADLYGDAVSWTPFKTVEHARSAGTALARLHEAAKGFDAPQRKVRPLVASFTIFASESPAAELECYLAARPALAANESVHACSEASIELLTPFHQELRPFLSTLKPLWTHNDLHASNMLWSNDGDNAQATEIIDFGLADRTNAIHDLAQAIERNLVEWLFLVEDPRHPERVPVHFDHLFALLDGYESVRSLGDEEAALLAPMTALCHAEFALSEADYFLGVLHSEQKASMAYDGWLLGHARWFRSSAGKRLLDALRRWARARGSVRRKS
jgi:Ser/Thr protein kinase RdoA (MazF antagonist)